MARYQVGRDIEEDDIRWPWRVVDTHPDSGTWELGPTFTDAEANIIAFALNAVAEGRELYALAHGNIDGDFRTYRGPTEGVAP